MRRDIDNYTKVRIIGTYLHVKQLIELIQREYDQETSAVYFTPKLSPHPGHGTTHLIINYFHDQDGGGDHA